MMTRLDLTIRVTCDYCGREHVLKVNQEHYKSWKQGEVHIQDAFPYLKPSDRELLISHCCGECWDRIMSIENTIDDNDDPEDTDDIYP